MEEHTRSPLLDIVTKEPVRTGGVMALGNFDGVHRGHAAVIETAAKVGKKLSLPVHALTFEPHPYSLFQSTPDPFLLTQPEDKRRLLLKAGADAVVSLGFTPAFSALTPEQFIQDVLIGACRVAHVVVGFDFVFGCRRGGDLRALRKAFDPIGVGVTEVPPLRDEGGEIISSSRIRAAIRKGDADGAAKLLARPFSVRGKIEQGAQRGRTLNFPTANIALQDTVHPFRGVYAITAHKIGDPISFYGVANFGLRPTFGGTQEWLEFHLFDFEGSLYESEWEVSLHHFLRSEQAFADRAALTAQIQNDAAAAKTYFAKGG